MEIVMLHTLRWTETEIKELTVADDEILGLSVQYEPTDSEGEVKKKDDGRLYIEWSDAPDTYLDTEKGVEILKRCRPL
ncbi:MAG: hypothetical protein ABIC04_00990 [Nanoarchaeota archaeon]